MRRALIQTPQRWRSGTMVGVYYMISLFSSPMSFRKNSGALGLAEVQFHLGCRSCPVLSSRSDIAEIPRVIARICRDEKGFSP